MPENSIESKKSAQANIFITDIFKIFFDLKTCGWVGGGGMRLKLRACGKSARYSHLHSSLLYG